MSENLSRLVSGATVFFLGSGASKLCLMAFELIAARVLGASDFGLYAICAAFLLLLASISQLGFDYGVVQALSLTDKEAKEERAAIIRVTLFTTTLLSAVLALVLVSFKTAIAAYVLHKPQLSGLLAITALTLPLQTFNQTTSAALRGLFRVRDSIVALDALRNAVLLLAAPVILLFKISPASALWIVLAATTIGTAHCFYLLRDTDVLKWSRAGDWRIFRELFRFARPLMPWSVMQRTSGQLSTLIAAALLSTAETGLLALVFRLTLFLNIPQTAVNAVAQAEFAQLWHKGMKGALIELYHQVSVSLTILATLCAIPFMVDPAFVMKELGPKSLLYLQYAWIVWPLMASKLLNVGLGPAGLLLVATHRRALLLTMTFYDIFCLLALAAPLSFYFGVTGFTVAVTAQSASSVLIRQHLTGRGIGGTMFSRDFLRLAPIVVATLAAGAAVSENQPSLTRFLAGNCIAFGLILAVLLVTGRGMLTRAGLSGIPSRIRARFAVSTGRTGAKCPRG